MLRLTEDVGWLLTNDRFGKTERALTQDITKYITERIVTHSETKLNSKLHLVNVVNAITTYDKHFQMVILMQLLLLHILVQKCYCDAQN